MNPQPYVEAALDVVRHTYPGADITQTRILTTAADIAEFVVDVPDLDWTREGDLVLPISPTLPTFRVKIERWEPRTPNQVRLGLGYRGLYFGYSRQHNTLVVRVPSSISQQAGPEETKA